MMLRFLRATILILMGLVFSATGAFAAGSNWYVLKGAGGSNNGTNWTNAWNEMSSINFGTVACGDTIWLGGGTYTSDLVINKTCTAGAPLTIESVIAGDTVPIGAAGYTAAVLNQVILNNSSIDFAAGAYVTVSGRKGNPITGVAFGILQQCPGLTDCRGITGAENGSIDHMTMTYIEALGPTCVDSGSCTGNADGINIAPSSSAQVTNTLIDHVYAYRWSEIIRCANWNTNTIQYSWLADDQTTQNEHADVMYSYPNDNLTMRYNTIWTNANDGIFFEGSGFNNFRFYGNVYFHSGGALITWKAGSSYGSSYVYNNVFENDTHFGDYSPAYVYPSSNMAAGAFENNIMENTTISGGFPGAVVTDYNAYSTSVGKQDNGAHSFTYAAGTLGKSAMFINEADSNPVVPTNINFHLTAAGIAAFKNGIALAAPYNMDMDGNTRGSGGSWYIGAFQAGSAASAPQPPTGLLITTQ